MRLKTVIFLASLLLVQSAVIPVYGASRKKKKDNKEEKVEKKKETSYDKLFKGKKCETERGLITLHKMDNKIYFELPLNILVISVTVEPINISFPNIFKGNSK